MIVNVKFFSNLNTNLVSTGKVEVLDNSTVSDILKKFEINEYDVAIVVVNGQISQFDTRLTDNDNVMLIPSIGGG
ncbi:MoaD/ThiS family protein [Desulfohalobium retbaense]|uniref:ThiamineS protein n=1 Tax=Desulfohalobium retbaense (strain ATCC 49708 / DSM 5692 / JCM 16813 / HR100) TaxID=485915 RepID=C8X5A5_DESRD|nr:MoaD/ThiS family protein [Desulfohalobium retbaense]ACV69602.1 thiamineS protein [Desulfohalobium retbaense DSM 5692]